MTINRKQSLSSLFVLGLLNETSTPLNMTTTHLALENRFSLLSRVLIQNSDFISAFSGFGHCMAYPWPLQKDKGPKTDSIKMPIF
jgi:hypothetical protein